MIHVILASLVVLVWVNLACATPTYFWIAGMETAVITECPRGSVGANQTVVTSPIRSGAYALSLAVDASNFCGSPATIGGTTYFQRGYFQSAANPSARSILGFFVSNTGATPVCLTFETTGKLGWIKNCAGSPIATSTNTVNLGAWNLIEWKAVSSTTVGGMELKLNGTTEFTSLGTDTQTGLGTSIVYAGFSNTAGGATRYWDDMAVCTGDYCGPGAIIARQGKAGTPTYNGWTKNSCTTIDECWSETPFSATKNASVTTDIPQTMLVATFNSTQTGHGSEIIRSSDTINACSVAVVGKQSAGGSGFPTIRRRVNGSNTDGTFNDFTGSTADRIFVQAPFATTPGAVETAEIGLTGGAIAGTITTEDAWLFCDYIAGANPVRHKVTQ